MKKILISVLSAGLLMTSCSSDEPMIPGNGTEQQVTFTINVPDAMGTRAGEVDSKDGGFTNNAGTLNYTVALLNQDKEVVWSSNTPDSYTGKTATFSPTVVLGYTYNIVAYATFDAKVTAPSEGVKIEGDVALANIATHKGINNESEDAYFCNTTIVGAPQMAATLKRPFGKLRLVAEDYDKISALGLKVASVKVSYGESVVMETLFDAQTGTFSEGAESKVYTYAGETAYSSESEKEQNGEYTVFVDYLPAAPADEVGNVPETMYPFEIEVTYADNKGTYTRKFSQDIPVKRNYLTTLRGNFFTTQAQLTLTVEEMFEEPGINQTLWNGEKKEVTPNAEGVYEIAEASELAWFAAQVNEGVKEVINAKVELVDNIYLNNVFWTPIGLDADSANKFSGEFEGNGYTIYGLNVQTVPGYTAAGLFGPLNGTAKNFTIDGAVVNHISTSNGATTNGIAVVAGSLYNRGHIDGVTVKNAEVSGNRYLGGISGYTYGSVTNCVVDGIKLHATPNAVSGGYDNGDKVGGIAGYYCSESVYEISGNTVNNFEIIGYRDLGGIIGGGHIGSKVANNKATNGSIYADQITNYYEDKDAHAGEIVGRIMSGTLGSGNTFENVRIIKSGESLVVASSMVLEDIVINAKSGSAVVIAENADVTLEIKGNVTLVGATGGEGIEVPASSKLTLTGAGNLVVKGNAGKDDENGGSGIGNVDNRVGEIVISDLTSITAEGYGKHAFGIGGNTALVKIENSVVEYVRGGYPQANLVNDTKYGISEPEGGAAIGLGFSAPEDAKVVLNGVTVNKADGGSKAAAIGAQYWASADIEISNSTLKAIQGGNASAGIGGSRVSDDSDQTIDIKIVNSNVTATGGEYGAGIGSGYNTHTNVGLISENNIEISGNSVINAKGGRYAAGIGTGYHVGRLTGFIADGVTVNANPGDITFYKDTYTTAQAIGYGIVDPAREASELVTGEPTFTVAGNVIANPVKAIGQK